MVFCPRKLAMTVSLAYCRRRGKQLRHLHRLLSTVTCRASRDFSALERDFSALAELFLEIHDVKK